MKLALIGGGNRLQGDLVHGSVDLRGGFKAAQTWAASCVSSTGADNAMQLQADNQACLWVQEVKVLTAMWVPARVDAALATCSHLQGTVIATPGCYHKLACTIVPAIDGTKYNESDLWQLVHGGIVAAHPRLSRFKHPQMPQVSVCFIESL